MRRGAPHRPAEKKAPRFLEGREQAGAKDSRPVSPEWIPPKEESGSHRRR